MSRICVKSLPKYTTEERLKEFFSGVGELTDVKIVRTKDGKSRQFAFIGFKEPEGAEAAVRRFNRAFMDTARLSVEAAKDLADDGALKSSWSRFSKKKLEHKDEGKKAAGTPGKKEGDKEAAAAAAGAGLVLSEKESKLKEYLAAKDTSAHARSWANDDAISGKKAAAAAAADKKTAESDAEEEEEKAGSSDSEDYDELPAGSKGKAAKSSSKKAAAPAPLSDDLAFLRAHVKKDFGDSDAEDEKAEGEKEEAGLQIEGEEGQTEKKKAEAKKSSKAEKEKEKEGSKDSKEKGKAGGKQQTRQELSVETVAEAGRLFVRNLPYSCTEEQLHSFFSKWGLLADVNLPKDMAGKPKGFAFILYAIPEQAVLALSEADGRVFMGRLLHVMPAAPEPSAAGAAEGEAGAAGAGEKGSAAVPGGSSYKAEKERQRKAAAASGAEAAGGIWNTFFLRSDTGVAALAERMGMQKGEFLDREASGMAVKVALAETQLVSETLDFLKGEGVQLPTLEQSLQQQLEEQRKQLKGGAAPAAAAAAVAAASSSKSSSGRSKTVILVKNLPYDADATLLREAFGRFGPLLRFVLPPSRALCLIEFVEPRQAKKAFAGLAYSRFQRVPLYLEWAPEGVFAAPAAGSAAEAAVAEAAALEAKKEEKRKQKEAAAAAEKETLEKERLEEEKRASKLVGSKRGRGGKGDDEEEDSDSDSAEKEQPQSSGMSGKLADHRSALAAAAAALTSAAVDSSSDAAASSTGAAGAGGSVPAVGTTLYVKNVSFQSTEEGLRDMFAALGPVRSVRIPKRRNPHYNPSAPAAAPPARGEKVDTSASGNPGQEWLSMGFGFVEFHSAVDATKALKVLQGKELDGHSLQLKLAAQSAAQAGVGASAIAGGMASTTGAVISTKHGQKKGQSSTAAGLAAGMDVPDNATKLLVRNLAFEATKKDLQDLFSAYGAIKTLRLPRKFDGTHRGFAFIEFLTHSEAAAAMNSLASTHLYGRHLVLEWSLEEKGAGGKGVGAGAGAGAEGGMQLEEGGSSARAGGAAAPAAGAAAAGTKKQRQMFFDV